MYKFILIPALFFVSLAAFSQKEANIWYFGKNAGLDFNGGAPVALTDGAMDPPEGCTSISDKDGNLLFYSDGQTIWNKEHDTMPNGKNLRGDRSSSQSSLIVKKPGTENIYYLFTTDVHGVTDKFDGLFYTEVDMNNGLGVVTANKNILLAAPTCEKLTAVRHANGTDIWVITHEWGNKTFLAFSITSAGVNMVPVASSTGETMNGSGNNALGYLKTSPNGKFLALAIFSKFRGMLCNFDDETGIVDNPITLPVNGSPYGVEFSPSSEVLYISISRPQTTEILQYDLVASDIPGSQYAIDVNINGVMRALQLGPDEKIYGSILGHDSISVIINPDVIGAGSNFNANGIFLEGRTCGMGLPNFLASTFIDPPEVEEDSVDVSGFYFPKAFSPNDDNINDILLPLTEKSLIDFDFQIFDRWGELIYQTNNITKGWDGKKNGKPVPVGTYAVKITYSTSMEEKEKILEDVKVIR